MPTVEHLALPLFSPACIKPVAAMLLNDMALWQRSQLTSANKKAVTDGEQLARSQAFVIKDLAQSS